MRSLHVLVPLTMALLVGSTVPALAQVPGQGSSTLHGVVCSSPYDPSEGYERESCYGGIVPNATVKLQKSGQVGPVGAVEKTAQTDEGGQYAFTGLEDAAYTVTVTRVGLDTLTATVDVKGDTARDFTLKPQSVVVTGKVSDPQGKALQGARVWLCCTGNDPQATTDAGGAFSLNTLAGQQYAYAMAPGFHQAEQPFFADGQQPLAFTLKPTPPQTSKVIGLVKDQQGNALAGMRIDVYSNDCCYTYDAPQEGYPNEKASIMRPGYGGSNWTTTDDAGRYTIHVNPGYYSLSVSHADFASHSYGAEIKDGQTQTHDITLNRYPPKTARITGTVVDAETGEAIRAYSLSVNSPQYGRYECSDHGMQPQPAQGGSGTSGGSGGTEPAQDQPAPDQAAPDQPAARAAPAIYPAPESSCAIRVAPDGSFEGLVTPGYTILNVWVVQECIAQRDTDGSSSSQCGKEYLQFVRTLDLAADETTTLTLDVKPRPGPDAIAQGYVLDDATGKPLTKASVAFTSLATYGYGWAEVDGDGSYRLRLRSGAHHVTVYAEGYLHWEGIVDVKPGDNDLDLSLRAGQEAGGCYACYPMAEKGAPAPMAAADGPSAMAMDSRSGAAQADESYADLNGGLGPYDAEARKGAGVEDAANAETRGSPSGAAGLVVAALAMVAFALRRRDE